MFTIPNGTSNSDLQAQPDTVDWQILEQGTRGDGVTTTADLLVSQRAAGANMSVDVAAGTATIGAITTATIGAQNIAVTSNSSGNPRFDLVYVNTAGTVAISTGTAAAAPVFPTIPANSLILAALYVPTGATSITTSRINDKRIKCLQNTQGFLTIFSLGDGALTTNSGTPFPQRFKTFNAGIEILGVSAETGFSSGPVGSSIILDLVQSDPGTSLWNVNDGTAGHPDHRPTITAGTDGMSAEVVPDITSIGVQTSIRVQCRQIGSTTAGSFVVLSMRWRWAITS